MANLKKVLEKAAMSSMATPKKEKSTLTMPEPCDYDEDKYPYGLRVDLNTESLKALGLDAKDFTAGGEVMIKAKCDVIGVRDETRRKKSHQNVDLQITELAIVKEGK